MGRKSLAPERRTQLVDAYYRCVVARGIEGCTMRAIAEEAGMAPSIITHYFGSIEEITKELIARVIEMHEGLVSRQLAALGDPAGRLEKLLSILFSEEYLADDFARVYTSVLYRASQDEEVRIALSVAMRRCYSTLVEVLNALAKPEFRDKAELEETAALIIAFADGTLIHAAISPGIVRPATALETARGLLKPYLKDVKRAGREAGRA